MPSTNDLQVSYLPTEESSPVSQLHVNPFKNLPADLIREILRRLENFQLRSVAATNLPLSQSARTVSQVRQSRINAFKARLDEALDIFSSSKEGVRSDLEQLILDPGHSSTNFNLSVLQEGLNSSYEDIQQVTKEHILMFLVGDKIFTRDCPKLKDTLYFPDFRSNISSDELDLYNELLRVHPFKSFIIPSLYADMDKTQFTSFWNILSTKKITALEINNLNGLLGLLPESPEVMTDCISRLPLKRLKLTDCDLSSLDSAFFNNLMNLISNSKLDTLDLSKAGLGKLSSARITQLAQAIQKCGVKRLGIANNQLWNLPSEALQPLAHIIQTQLSSLKLSISEIGEGDANQRAGTVNFYPEAPSENFASYFQHILSILKTSHVAELDFCDTPFSYLEKIHLEGFNQLCNTMCDMKGLSALNLSGSFPHLNDQSLPALINLIRKNQLVRLNVKGAFQNISPEIFRDFCTRVQQSQIDAFSINNFSGSFPSDLPECLKIFFETILTSNTKILDCENEWEGFLQEPGVLEALIENLPKAKFDYLNFGNVGLAIESLPLIKALSQSKCKAIRINVMDTEEYVDDFRSNYYIECIIIPEYFMTPEHPIEDDQEQFKELFARNKALNAARKMGQQILAELNSNSGEIDVRFFIRLNTCISQLNSALQLLGNADAPQAKEMREELEGLLGKVQDFFTQFSGQYQQLAVDALMATNSNGSGFSKARFNAFELAYTSQVNPDDSTTCLTSFISAVPALCHEGKLIRLDANQNKILNGFLLTAAGISNGLDKVDAISSKSQITLLQYVLLKKLERNLNSMSCNPLNFLANNLIQGMKEKLRAHLTSNPAELITNESAQQKLMDLWISLSGDQQHRLQFEENEELIFSMLKAMNVDHPVNPQPTGR